MQPELETELTARAWRDPRFARRLRTDPADALAELGITLPEHVKLDIRVQDPNTLYFVIPPLRSQPAPEQPAAPNQMDLWRSRDIFTWMLPERLKLHLLAMRQQYRRSSEQLSSTGGERNTCD